jgi:hypothetical protein
MFAGARLRGPAEGNEDDGWYGLRPPGPLRRNPLAFPFAPSILLPFSWIVRSLVDFAQAAPSLVVVAQSLGPLPLDADVVCAPQAEEVTVEARQPVVIALDTPDQLPIIAITLDTYSHVLPNLRDAAAAAMEEALS